MKEGERGKSEGIKRRRGPGDVQVGRTRLLRGKDEKWKRQERRRDNERTKTNRKR